MAARALGSATISFGLVSIPVKLYSTAESASAVRFNQINKADGARVKQQLISSKSGEIVAKEDIVKGYEFAKGQYVLFTADELKALEAKATHTVDITEFVPADTVDRIYFDKAYFLGPDKGGARAYHLLAETLRATNRVAIAQYSARGRQRLTMVRPLAKGLLMEQLHYADEIRSIDDVPIEDADVKAEELKLAQQLVDQATSEGFDPGAYRDEVKARMLELIQQKIDGEDITLTPTEEPQTKVVDIMSALKASLAESGERKPARRTNTKKKTTKRASKKKRARK